MSVLREDLSIVTDLEDLHKQATEERSHYYTGSCIRRAIAELKRKDAEVERLRSDAALAYGLLWLVQGDSSLDENVRLAYSARKALFGSLTAEERKAGIELAQGKEGFNVSWNAEETR